MSKRKTFQISNALTEGLEETIIAAQNYSGELRVEIVPIKKIELDPENPREFNLEFNDLPYGPEREDPLYEQKKLEKESLTTIANSIKEQGIINPIVVYKSGERYRLIAGERRTLASLLIGKSDIQAKVLDKKPASLKLALLQWAENIEREDLSLWERMRNLEKITQAYATESGMPIGQLTATDLKEIVGCSLPHAMNYKAVLQADANLKQLIKDNKIKNLEKAAFIANTENTLIREKLIHACVSGASLKEMKNTASSAKLADKANLKKVQENRGRQANRVNLGVTTNLKAVKLLVESVLSQPKVEHLNLSALFKNLAWNDYSEVNKAFRQLLSILEKNER